MSHAAEQAPQQAPEISSVHVLSLDELENDIVRTGVSYWRALRGGRSFPPRSLLSTRDMAGVLRRIVLVRIIDGGRDYEFRIVGDAHVQGYGMDFNRMRNSDIERIAPEHGAQMRVLYEHVRNTGQPLAFRGWVGREVKDALFVYHESAFLPLGETGDTVDHILVVSIYVPKVQS
jgi:hypothetical protein